MQGARSTSRPTVTIAWLQLRSSLGACSVIALMVPEFAVAYQIPVLNIE